MNTTVLLFTYLTLYSYLNNIIVFEQEFSSVQSQSNHFEL